MHTERKFYGRLHRTTDSTEMKRSGIEGVAGGRYGVQITKLSGGDALRGNTRTHPEHVG